MSPIADWASVCAYVPVTGRRNVCVTKLATALENQDLKTQCVKKHNMEELPQRKNPVKTPVRTA